MLVGSIGMPPGVAAVIISVAGEIVEVFPQEPAQHGLQPGMVQQGTEFLTLVDEWHNARALRSVVGDFAIPKDRLEL